MELKKNALDVVSLSFPVLQEEYGGHAGFNKTMANMSDNSIHYDFLVQDALRTVLRKVLRETARVGLPGDHHFYITFNTQAPGVRLSSHTRQKHPEELTIVLQHQFWDLAAHDTSFEVGLSFGGVPEKICIPYRAIKTFVDPSIPFSLEFDEDCAHDQKKSFGMEDESDGNERHEITLVIGRVFPSEEEIDAMLDAEDDDGADYDEDEEEDDRLPPGDAEAAQEGGARVVSLDAFRKKNSRKKISRKE